MMKDRKAEMTVEKEEMMESGKVEMMEKEVLWMFWLSYFLSPFLFLSLVFFLQ